jgi:hypothetical protein
MGPVSLCGMAQEAPTTPQRTGEEVPSFVDTEDVDFVYRLISDLREKARAVKTTF